MDYLQKIITDTNVEQSRKYRKRGIPFMQIINKPYLDYGGNSIRQRGIIMEIVKDTFHKITAIRARYPLGNYRDRWKGERIIETTIETCVDRINKYSLSDISMYLILKEIDETYNHKLFQLLLNVLFQYGNGAFFSLIKQSAEPLKKMNECAEGDIILFDYQLEKRG
jgi:hypothetical protein